MFDKSGTITAANSSKISDGAAACVLMSRDMAEKLGVEPLARILSEFLLFPTFVYVTLSTDELCYAAVMNLRKNFFYNLS